MSHLRFISKSIRIRSFSAKIQVELDKNVQELLESDEMHYRRHPGVVKPRFTEVPRWISDSISILIQDSRIPKNDIHKHGQKLTNYLNARHAPLSKEELKVQLNALYPFRRLYPNKENKDNTNGINKVDSRMEQLQKHHEYNWKNIAYNRYMGLLYLANKSIPDYIVLHKIFNEIKHYDKDFKPTTLFDFGSGVGTVMWAASELWTNSLEEYFGVDISNEMNNIANDMILYNTNPIKKIYHRQFFPVQPVPFDLVVCAYSLMELPNAKSRADVILTLWKKVQHYLIIVEEGTNAGFAIINEVRNVILKEGNFGDDDCHVFSPCPHDMKCPRYTTDDTPCNFEAVYKTSKVLGSSNTKKTYYSYVVLKKGKRPENQIQWPRIVRPKLKRSRHVICRMCTAFGTLEEAILTAEKCGKNTYCCAKVSEWGDLLPVKITKNTVHEE